MFSSSIPAHIKPNFRTLDKLGSDRVGLSLRQNYFAGCPEGYLSSEWGRKDFDNHAVTRLNQDRQMIVPWLDAAKPLQGAAILEIGCGTGCSTVALAEQGAKVTAIDLDENSLAVARDRCAAYDLEVSFACANATEVNELFADRHFDYIIFYAALEHMTLNERLSAMRATWNMLSAGGLWCVIDTPNRLWYFDTHTSVLPFHMWLPDELAFKYSRFSPRENYRELYRDYTDEAALHFLRRGRGVSFHEFELSMKPLGSLSVKSSLNMPLGKKRLADRLRWRWSDECRYLALLQRIAPAVHPGFLQSYLNLILIKD